MRYIGPKMKAELDKDQPRLPETVRSLRSGSRKASSVPQPSSKASTTIETQRSAA